MLKGMSDLEVMRHRFSTANVHKSTGNIAQVLGVDRKEYEEAVMRGLEQEAEMRARRNNYWE